MERSYLKSPFENVMSFLNSIPQSHEKALKHALYNAIALLLAFVCVAAGWGVFYVLQPFVKPLMWALLTGSVLHPFKHSIAKRFELWIRHLEESSTPFVLFILVTPVKLVDDVSEVVGSTIVSRIRLLVMILVSTVTVFVLYNYIPNFCVAIITKICDINYQLLLFIMDNFSTKIFVAVIIGYAVVLTLYWSEESSHLFSITSYCIWFVISIFAARSFGVLQIPLFLLILFCLSFGFAFELITVLNVTAENMSCWKTIQKAMLGKFGARTEDDVKNSRGESDGESFASHDTNKSKENKEESCENADDENATDRKDVAFEKDQGETQQEASYPRSSSSSSSSASSAQEKPSRIGNLTLNRPECQRRGDMVVTCARLDAGGDESASSKRSREMEESSKYIYAVLWACAGMMMWKHVWIVHLLPIPIAVYFIKNLGLYFGVWEMICSQWKDVMEAAASWIETRERAIFPAPVQGLNKLGARLRVKMMSSVRESIDSFASSLVILGLIVFTFSCTIFIALQIYAEGIHIISVGAEIINSTVVHNPEFVQLLPEGWGEKMDSALNNAYLYGREGISRQIQSLLKDVDKAKAAEFEKHLLEFWDRVYQAWLMGPIESSSTVGPKVSSGAVFSSWRNFMDLAAKMPDMLHVGVMTDFARENVGTLVSLLESIWALLKGNINLISQFFFATISILLGGSTAVLNFVVSLVVFFTALFYLLSSSGQLYKPVDLLSSISPVSGNQLGVAFEGAVNGVFKASFKMALFYGLWTWLIHNLFQVRIVYLPSVLAAVLGAVPFLGTYWASVPAVLELWLVQHKAVHAIALLVIQCVPISFVDAAIYTEIKGGGHPYMTGLAIAGGVFCMGIEGAILGPVLLCCLLVALNMSTSLMKDSPLSELSSLSKRQLRRWDTIL